MTTLEVLPAAVHAARHATGGQDPITPDSIGALTALEAALKFGFFINPMDPAYAGGAKGDGIADDTAAFVAARTAANASTAFSPGPIPVYVPGQHRVNLVITDDQPVMFFGPGQLLQRVGASALTVTRGMGSSRAISGLSTFQAGVNTPSQPTTDRSATKITFSGPVADLHNGSLLFITSQDAYANDYSPGLGQFTYKAGYALVHGLGLSLSAVANGGPLQGDTVTGGTSGSTAVVSGVTAMPDGTNTVIFTKVSAAFTSGETLTVGGQSRATVSGTLFVLTAGQLIDTYSTSPVAYVIPTNIPCVLDIGINAETDPDAYIGVGTSPVNRQPALLLQHVANADVKADVKNAYTRAVELDCCYACDVDAKVEKLPNSTNLENAYGYGVDLYGATEACRVKVIGRNMRHAFTTNVTWNTAFAFVDIREIGAPKHNKVYDSMAFDSIAAGFDTHAGAFFTTFDNCQDFRLFSGGRESTASAAFQNRAWGTVRNNCVAHGAVIGFSDLSDQYGTPPIPHTTIDRGCVARGYQDTGFRAAGSNTGTAPTGSLHLRVDCEAYGDGTAINTPYYQSGFSNEGANVRDIRCTSRNFNGAPYRNWTNAGGTYVNDDCVSDYTESPTGYTGIRFDTAPTAAVLTGHKVYLPPTATNLAAVVRVNGCAVNLTTDGAIQSGGAAQPFSTLTSGGTLAITAVGTLAETNRATTAEALLAPLASPALTGVPTAPTAAGGTSTTQIATTAFVTAAVSGLDDVLAFANLAAFPGTGTTNTIYVANDTEFLYRWSGSAYIQVGGGSIADATTSGKGVVQLAGDLAGTAAAPTVPGLATNATAITNLTAAVAALPSPVAMALVFGRH